MGCNMRRFTSLALVSIAYLATACKVVPASPDETANSRASTTGPALGDTARIEVTRAQGARMRTDCKLRREGIARIDRRGDTPIEAQLRVFVAVHADQERVRGVE